MSSRRDGMMRAHNVTRCPDWCTQPDDEEQHETHQGQLVTYETSGGTVVHLQLVGSWWTRDEDKVIVTTVLDEYGQMHLSIDDWRDISALGDELADRYDAGGEIWAYDGAEHDEAGAG